MNQYFIHDARKVNEIPIKSPVDVIITSPPYFDMKDYGSNNQIGFGQNYDSYLNDIEQVFRNCYEITKDTGSLWMVVDILRKEGELKLLPFDMVQKVQNAGWQLRDIIIWEKDKTVPYTHKGEMRNIFEYILYFTKTNNFKFYRERITSINDLKEWWQRYPERYSPNGKSPSNIWEYPIPLQGSWGKTYIKHFCPLPEGLIERMIHLSSDVNDTVLDPFAGSGAVLSSAYRLKRNYIGCDLSETYKNMFMKYIKKVKPVDVKKIYDNNLVNNFSKTIGKLRTLKFPKKLFIEYKKKYPEVLNNITSIIVVPQKNGVELPKNKFISCTYLFVYKDSTEINEEQLLKVANAQPLSKYGVYPEFKIITSDQAIKYLKKNFKVTGYCKYENGIIYKPGITVKNLEKELTTNTEENRFPLIYSTLHLSEEELSSEI